MSTDSPKPRCYLLELPVELRLMIYEHTRHPVELYSQWSTDSPHSPGPELEPVARRFIERKPQLYQMSLAGAPFAALLRSCSIVRNEYEKYLGTLEAAKFLFFDYDASIYRFSFQALDCHADEFGLVSDTLLNKLHNLTHLRLDFYLYPRTLTMKILKRLKVLLDCFPRLTRLDVCLTCFYNKYRRWRETNDTNSFWLLFGQTATFKAHYPNLVVLEELKIICDFAYPFHDIRWVEDEDDLPEPAREEFKSWPRHTIFKAVPSDSPYAWEGLELEQLYTW